MAIPYMGGKRVSSGMIYQAIKNLNQDEEVFVDLFCGGFSVSEYFLKNGWKVISNDKNKYVIALLKEVIFNGLDEKKVLEFVSRETFYDIIKNPTKYDDWYVGYVQCVWSFGNSQKSYLFGKEVEQVKLAGHEIVVNKNCDLIKKLIPDIPQKYLDGIMKQDNWHKRRMALVLVANRLGNRTLELEQLERLQRLQRLQQLEQLEITNKDYREVVIPEKAIVYCDPPYQGTATYAEGGFNHLEFWDWVREKSKTNKIYISEYNAPEDFKIVLKFSRNSTLSGGNNKGQPDECLFTII